MNEFAKDIWGQGLKYHLPGTIGELAFDTVAIQGSGYVNPLSIRTRGSYRLAVQLQLSLFHRKPEIGVVCTVAACSLHVTFGICLMMRLGKQMVVSSSHPEDDISTTGSRYQARLQKFPFDAHMPSSRITSGAC